MVDMYLIEYDYLDKRERRRAVEVKLYTREKALNKYRELKQMMKDGVAKAPIDNPHVIVNHGGEFKQVNFEEEIADA